MAEHPTFDLADDPLRISRHDRARVSVVIPTVPPREVMMRRAVSSVNLQTEPCDLYVVTDTEFERGRFTGTAGKTRNRGIALAQTEWTAFLDDDDWLFPEHVAKLLAHAEKEKADLVYPWFDGPNDSVLGVRLNGRTVSPEGIAWCSDLEGHLRLTDQGHLSGNFIPITVLVRTELLKRVGGFAEPDDRGELPYSDEAWDLWIKLLDAGATFAHLPERTWHWNVHGRHLSRMHFP